MSMRTWAWSRFLDVDNFAFELIACAEFHELSLLLTDPGVKPCFVRIF